MAKHPQEDLFEATTMSFGDHLEELRGSLTRALIGLTIGSLIGLIFANHVVGVIQKPLLDALGSHYAGLAVNQLEDMYGNNVLDPQTVKFVEKSAFVFDEVYIERELLTRLDEGPAPTVAAGDANQPSTAEKQPGNAQNNYSKMKTVLDEVLPPPKLDMVKIRLWKPARAKLTTLSPHESFMIWVKAGLVAGLILSSPYVFYQIWVFVAAGLYPHEKKYVHLYLPFSLILFLSGAALAFFFVFGPVLTFLFGFARLLNIEPDLRISEVIGFVLFLPLGFGIAFQLPLVMLFIHRIGLISIETYLEKWRVAILLIFVISMLLTPSDPYSMLLMAMPLTGLYFLGLALCKWMPRGKNPFSEAYDP